MMANEKDIQTILSAPDTKSRHTAWRALQRTRQKLWASCLETARLHIRRRKPPCCLILQNSSTGRR